MKARTLALCGVVFAWMCLPASAQQVTKICVPNTTNSGCTPVDSNNPFPVTGGGGGGGGTSSNFGSAFPAAGTAAGFKDSAGTNMAPGNLTSGGAIKTDESSVAGTTALVNAGATGAGSPRVTVAQDPTTMAGSAPGTAGTPATTVGSMQGVSGGTPLPGSLSNGADTVEGTLTDAASCSSGTSLLACQRQTDADVKGPGNVQGIAASGATDTDIPLNSGGRAATAAPTAVTDGQKVVNLLGETGKQVILPYSIKETAVRGTITSTDTAAHTIIASAGGSLKNYIVALQCGRTDAGATAITLTFNDSASSVFVLPAGGATNIPLPIPLATAAATAFQVTSGTSVSTLYCSAQGFTGL